MEVGQQLGALGHLGASRLNLQRGEITGWKPSVSSGPSGLRMTFTRDEAGQVTGLILHQPGSDRPAAKVR